MPCCAPRRWRPGVGAVAFDAEVTQKLMLGSRTQFHLRAGDAALIAEIGAGPQAALEIGQTARFSFDPADIAWVND